MSLKHFPPDADSVQQREDVLNADKISFMHTLFISELW